ncbi:type I polyketide synthase [Paenibacillus sp. MMS18-CY102]|uniref:type I polyketide synthase n=1 Tax=Paenibacillus sp. MMS18-CY102 TaxID=2682849 RepID=UPI0013654658|nr:type I polyketide synthase [Paenibacillus sp. MMS18-CY102]MWC28973.1 SDR family NAD(P)-dependent oxidoreductase [Paenibacillus sp. MMS18-CY102]
MNKQTQAREPIAIIGMGCRFPGGANDPQQYWEMLRAGVDAITEVPSGRWSISSFYDPARSKPGKTAAKWGGFIDKVDEFDARFFGISPREASMMDPQQRLLLETCWEALEAGGQIVSQMAGSKTGVFMGGFTLDYQLLQFSESNRHLVDSHSATGTMMTLLANRISYAFDFRGPSMALDTACSSSLVAVHMACQSIWSGESTVALAGGVNVMLKPDYFVALSKPGMLSPDGRSKTFDSSANGYVRGEGAGVVVLKPLSQALADGDPIHALIRGTAVNQDGSSAGITVPRGEAQEALMREAYERAGVDPSEVQYVEAHGTGTAVGDPIEAAAIGHVISSGSRPDGQPCYIGSVKTNIGHLEAAAGIAGLIKTVMSLKHKEIPPHLHLKQLNPQIKLQELKLRIPEEVTKWPQTNGQAIASVNSFGFGGTNAHVVLEEAPERATEGVKQEDGEQPAYLIPLSARSEQALAGYANQLRSAIASQPEQRSSYLHNMAYTASRRRDQHSHRLAVVVRTKQELVEALDAFAANESRPGMAHGHTVNSAKQSGEHSESRLAFVFTGMGPQWWAMGQQLYGEEPVFQKALDEINALLTPYTGWSLLEEMMGSESSSRMGDTEVAQTANFALQVGLAELWRSWGITPDAIVGHSAGEVAAAYIAGAMSLKEAVRVIYHRSHLQQKTTGQGKLVAVGLPLEEAKQLLEGYEDRVSIAAINSPNAVTLVGDPEALETIVQPLQANDVFYKYLRVNVPYHSHYMEPIKSELFDKLAGLELQRTVLPLYSTVTGALIEGNQLNEAYWWKNVREPVYFAAAAQELLKEGYNVFVEIGPHAVLSSSITECAAQHGKEATAVTSLRRGEPERGTILAALGSLYVLGYRIDWANVYPSGTHAKLPAYAWQRERYWLESEHSEMDRVGIEKHPLLGKQLPAPYPTWEKTIDADVLSALSKAYLQCQNTLPAAGYIELAVAAVRSLANDPSLVVQIEHVQFHQPLFLVDVDAVKLRLMIDPTDATFSVYSASTPSYAEWMLLTTGNIRTSIQSNEKIVNMPALLNQSILFNLQHARSTSLIKEMRRSCNEALAFFEIPPAVMEEIDALEVHPAVLDSSFHVLSEALTCTKLANGEHKQSRYLPRDIERLTIYQPMEENMWVHAKVEEQNAKSIKGDIQLLGEHGQLILEIQGCHAVLLEQEEGESIGEQQFYATQWMQQDRQLAREAAMANQAEGDGNWIIFMDGQGVGESLIGQLHERGERCFAVSVSQSASVEKDGDAYAIDPNQPAHFEQLFNELFGPGKASCRGIVHLWNLDADQAVTPQSLIAAEALTVNTALHIVQAVQKWAWHQKPQLWLVTRQAQPVDALTSLNVSQSTIWGFARSLGHQEHGDIWGGIIDLDGQPSKADASLLLDEIWHADEDDQIAIRKGVRYVARLLPVEKRPNPIPLVFRSNASYVITGGMGDLGQLVARWMIQQGARRLILIGRTALPPRSAWHEVDKASAQGRRIEAVQQLERLGASVHVASLDIAEQSELHHFLEQFEREGWPAIRGVIHAAGVLQSKLVTQMSADDFHTVLRPKVLGAWNLHQYFMGKELDFFTMFSSIASVVVSAGQGSYAAANSFLDALAHHRRAERLPAYSINWGPWEELGMGTVEMAEYMKKRGFVPIQPDQGLDMLERVLGQDIAQVMVVAADWPTVQERNYPMGISPVLIKGLLTEKTDGSPALDAPSDFNGPISSLLMNEPEPAKRLSLLLGYVQNMSAKVLRLSSQQLQHDQSLIDYGLDSMMAIELKSQMEKDLSVNISVADLLRGSTVFKLAEKIVQQLDPSAVEQSQTLITR